MVVLITLLTIFVGIWIDSLGRGWSRGAADVLAWGVYAWLLWRAEEEERGQLLWCVALAAAGECFLGFTWGLYQYRLGNLPLFIPPGHAVVFACGRRISGYAPSWMGPALATVLGAWCAAGAASGLDTQSLVWYPVFLACFVWGGSRTLYTTMFLLAFLVEAFGTGLGGWRYVARDPWFGLTTVTLPPIWTGAFYCILDFMILNAPASPVGPLKFWSNFRPKTPYVVS
ncbi:MAG: hypothetical protein ABI693_00835 [Bryobacteraceae bacterium]